MTEKPMTSVFQLNLPEELITEAERQPPLKRELKVEGWRSSWLTRISEKILGKD